MAVHRNAAVRKPRVRSPKRNNPVEHATVRDEVRELAMILADGRKERLRYVRGPAGSVAVLVKNR